MKTASRSLVALWAPLLVLLATAEAAPAPADLAPAQLLQIARQSTFEVVLPKIEPAAVRYEKPLPLELLNFTERNDKFWSIGTAFALAPDTYVSAAHVLLSGIGSPMGKPQLRDATGKVYPVDEILQFSMHEDFIVFRVKGSPARSALAPVREVATGAAVYAVGNALGEGVVLRDGLLTSMTPEDQDGRWKWLRFSAAASPGNSGGPLLDSQGRVAGVVVAKSPGENLNFALPIARVLGASKTAANIDVRSSFKVPVLRQQIIAHFKETFPLPASWEAFSRTVLDLSARQTSANQGRLLQQFADQLPPGGQSARFLATLDRESPLALIEQQADDSWGLSVPEGEEETELPDGSLLTTGVLGDAGSFQLARPESLHSASIYRDDVAFMDTLLKGLRIPRMVGQQAIRITSLGTPQITARHSDRFERIWQLRTWSVGYSDLLIVTMGLPTPSGYAGLVKVTSTLGYQDAVTELKLLTDYFHVHYSGSLAQWRTFIAERELCPPMLRTMQIEKGSGYALNLRNLAVKIPTTLLALDDESPLVLLPAYRSDGKTLHADFVGMTLSVREENASWIGIFGQSKPGQASGRKLEERWKQMSGRQGEFDGQPKFSSDYKDFWTTSVVGASDGDLLYEVVASWHEKSTLHPRLVQERRDKLLAALTPADVRKP